MSNKEAYREFAKTCLSLPLCYQPWYLDSVAENGHWDVALHVENNMIQGVWTWFRKRKFGLPYITMPHLTKWMGPWWPEAENLSLTLAHKRLESLYKQLPKAWQISSDWHPDMKNWLPLFWAGWKQTTRYTYTLDLKAENNPDAGINRNILRNLKKAGEALSIESVGSRAEFIRLHRMSFTRQGLIIPYSEALLNRHLDALEAHHALKMLFARNSAGKLCSVAALTWDAGRAYYHLSGDDPVHRQSGSGMLLVRESIRIAKEEMKLPLFDFEGSMIQGVEAVRRQFGAGQVPYFRVWKPLSPFRI
jgi:hypothetical protein